eukprot:m.803099 g.803099  ORF g.803099 m.803099 type:complete len:313 (-) comp59275_c0_seq52:1294-2232(-)
MNNNAPGLLAASRTRDSMQKTDLDNLTGRPSTASKRRFEDPIKAFCPNLAADRRCARQELLVWASPCSAPNSHLRQPRRKEQDHVSSRSRRQAQLVDNTARSAAGLRVDQAVVEDLIPVEFKPEAGLLTGAGLQQTASDKLWPFRPELFILLNICVMQPAQCPKTPHPPGEHIPDRLEQADSTPWMRPQCGCVTWVRTAQHTFINRWVVLWLARAKSAPSTPRTPLCCPCAANQPTKAAHCVAAPVCMSWQMHRCSRASAACSDLLAADQESCRISWYHSTHAASGSAHTFLLVFFLLQTPSRYLVPSVTLR